MRKMICFLMVIYTVCVHASFGGIDHVAVGLLTSDDPDLIKLGAKVIENERISNPRVLDVAAYQISEKVGKDQYIDLVSWLAKAIEQSEDSRYAVFMNSMLSEATDAKTKKYISSAIAAIEGESEDSFSPENIDLQSVKAELAGSTDGDFSRDGFDSVNRGDKISTVFEKVGSKPSSYEDYTVYVRRPFVGRLPTQRLVLLYSGLGAFRINSVDGDYVVDGIYHELDLDAEVAKGPGKEVIEMLAQYKPEIYREGAKRICSENQYSSNVLDVAAMRIWVDRDSEDGMVSDGVSWAAKCIGASANPRYRSFLERVVKETKNGKLEGYAEEALDNLLDAETEQFKVDL